MDIENLYRTGAIYDFIKNPPSKPPQEKLPITGSVRGGGGANRQHVGFNFEYPKSGFSLQGAIRGRNGKVDIPSLRAAFDINDRTQVSAGFHPGITGVPVYSINARFPF